MQDSINKDKSDSDKSVDFYLSEDDYPNYQADDDDEDEKIELENN